MFAGRAPSLGALTVRYSREDGSKWGPVRFLSGESTFAAQKTRPSVTTEYHLKLCYSSDMAKNPPASISEETRARGYVVGDRGRTPTQARPIAVPRSGRSEARLVGIFWEGVSEEDEEDPLVRVLRGRFQHQQRVATNFDSLVAAMMPSLSEADIVPVAMVAQAQRRAELRSKLLASGAFTYKALAEGRRMSASNLRQWVRRARERFELFTVEHDNETLVPAFLLDADLLPRPAFQPVIATLATAGEDGWGLWAWLVYPTSWLDGKVPAGELARNPEAVLRAAQDRASNSA